MSAETRFAENSAEEDVVSEAAAVIDGEEESNECKPLIVSDNSSEQHDVIILY